MIPDDFVAQQLLRQEIRLLHVLLIERVLNIERVYLSLINYYYYYIIVCNHVRIVCSDFCIFHSPLSLFLFHTDYCKNCELNKILQSKGHPVLDTLYMVS